MPTVNNTLTEAEKDKDKAKETEIYSDRDTNKTKERHQEKTTGEKENVGGKDINTGYEKTKAINKEDRYTGAIPKKSVAENRTDGELEERSTGSEKTTGGEKDKVDKDTDNSLNTAEKKEPEVAKPTEKKEGSPDMNQGTRKTDITRIVVIKEKGQEEKERKEEQVNGKREPDKVGPNDTKLRKVITENTVEIFEQERTKNNTVTYDTKDTEKENNTIVYPEPERKILPTELNVTQHTLYRAREEESGKPKEKPTIKEDKTEEEHAEKTKEELDREREEKEKEEEKEVNQSFTGKRPI